MRFDGRDLLGFWGYVAGVELVIGIVGRTWFVIWGRREVYFRAGRR